MILHDPHEPWPWHRVWSATRWVLIIVLAFAFGRGISGIDALPALGLPLLLLTIGLVLTGPFGILLGFIAVLFVRPGDIFPQLESIGLAKVFVVSSLLLVAGGKLLMRDKSWAKSHYNPWVAALTIGVIVSIVFSTDPGDSFAFFNDVFVKILVLWFLMMETILTRRRTVTFQVVIAVMTAGIAAYSIWAKFTATNLIEGTRSSFVGLLADPNDLALTLLMGTPFLIEAVMSPRLKASRPIWLILLVLNMGGLIVTQSRGGFLGLGAALFVILKLRVRSWIVVGAICMTGLVGLLVVSGITARQTVVVEEGYVDASARGRLDAWVAGGRMLVYNPLTGVGIFQVTDNFGVYAVNPVEWRPKTSHNAFVQAAAETGLLGFVPFMTLVFLAGWSDWRLLREMPREATPLQRALLRSQLSTLAGVMVAAFFLSVAWSWFFYIVIAQAATSHRVWLTMPEVLKETAARREAAAAAVEAAR